MLARQLPMDLSTVTSATSRPLIESSVLVAKPLFAEAA